MKEYRTFRDHHIRRHLTKGQQAMAVAMIRPKPAKTKRKGSGSLETKDQISMARTVLTQGPKDLAPQVLRGADSFATKEWGRPARAWGLLHRRRHMTAGQRAMAVAELANMNQGARTDLQSIDQRSQWR